MYRLALKTSTQTWVASMTIGISTYLLIMAGGKYIPAPVRLLFWGVPIGMGLLAVGHIGAMEKDRDEEAGMNALIRQQREHSTIRQHQLDLATRELDYLGTLQELRNMYQVNLDVPSPGADNQWGFDLASPFNLLEAAVPMDQKVMEQLGEPAVALWHYITQRSHNWCDKDGWVPIAKIRDNWGRQRNLKTEELRSLLSGLNGMGIGSWKDARLQEWRLEIPG